MSIRIKGLDGIERDLREMQRGLRLETLQEYASEIEEEARSLAASKGKEDFTQRIHVKVFMVKPRTFEIKANAPKAAFPFIFEATKSKLHDMPSTSQAVFESFLSQLRQSWDKP